MSQKIATEKEDLLTLINNLRSVYETENKSKKGFFSSKQYKFDCANTVLKTVDLEILINSAILVLPNSYHLFFDYNVFKTFAVPELFDTIIEHMISKIQWCLDTYGVYEMHIDLNTFSVSAFHRYKYAIEKYSKKIEEVFPSNLHEKIVKMNIYNTPSAIETISQLMIPFMSPETREKTIKYDKQASEKPLQTIKEIIQTSNNLQCFSQP